MLVIFSLVVGCGSGARPHTKRRLFGSRAITVVIGGYAYRPAEVKVSRGTRITFTNRDATAHTATSATTPAAIDTGTLGPGRSQTITITTRGTYSYYCQFHAFMRGTVRVSG